jgi:hypothetical protein
MWELLEYDAQEEGADANAFIFNARMQVAHMRQALNNPRIHISEAHRKDMAVIIDKIESQIQLLNDRHIPEATEDEGEFSILAAIGSALILGVIAIGAGIAFLFS